MVRGVQADSRQRNHDRWQQTTGRGSHPLLGSTSRPDFDDNSYFLLDFMRGWDMEVPASFEPLPLSTWVRLISSWSLRRGTTWSSGTQSSRACHSHFGVRRIIDLSPPRLPFSLSPLWLSPPLPFIRGAFSAILRRPSRYSSSTTVCRPSLQSVVQLPLSNSYPSWRALFWRPLLPVSLPGLVDRGANVGHSTTA